MKPRPHAPMIWYDLLACLLAALGAFYGLRLRHREKLARRSWGYILIVCLLQAAIAYGLRHGSGIVLGEGDPGADIASALIGGAVGSVSFFALTKPALRRNSNDKLRLGLGGNKLEALFDDLLRTQSRADEASNRDATVSMLLKSEDAEMYAGHPIFGDYLRFLANSNLTLSRFIRGIAGSENSLDARLDTVLGAMEEHGHFEFRRRQIAKYRKRRNQRPAAWGARARFGKAPTIAPPHTPATDQVARTGRRSPRRHTTDEPEPSQDGDHV